MSHQTLSVLVYRSLIVMTEGLSSAWKNSGRLKLWQNDCQRASLHSVYYEKEMIWATDRFVLCCCCWCTNETFRSRSQSSSASHSERRPATMPISKIQCCCSTTAVTTVYEAHGSRRQRRLNAGYSSVDSWSHMDRIQRRIHANETNVKILRAAGNSSAIDKHVVEKPNGCKDNKTKTTCWAVVFCAV